MIKAKNGKVKFNGSGKELAADYATIGISLRKILPAKVVDAAIEISKQSLEELENKAKEKKEND